MTENNLKYSFQDIPGPGKYHLPSQFRSDEVEIDGAAKPAFGSSLKVCVHQTFFEQALIHIFVLFTAPVVLESL